MGVVGWLVSWYRYKDEILTFAITLVKLEIMLSELSQRKTNTISFHSYVEFKKEMRKGGKKETNQERDSTIQGKLRVARGEVDGWVRVKPIQIKEYKLPIIK